MTERRTTRPNAERGRALALAMATTVAAGCTTSDGGGMHDAGLDASQPGCTAGTTGCIPERPAAGTSSPSDSVDATFALRDLLLEQNIEALPPAAQPWRTIGANLDGITTDSTSAANSCTVGSGPDGGVSALFPVDGVNGIDNQYGAHWAPSMLAVLDANLQDDVCCMQSRGRGTLLVRIRNWNGTANDASVILSLVVAVDGTSDDASTLTYDGTTENGYVVTGGSTPAATPSWMPDADTWYASSDSLTAGNLDQPRHVDVDGYVAGGYFVMDLDATRPIPIYLGAQIGTSLGLRDGTMVGHISANQHLIDEGWIAGRMDGAALLDFSSRLMASSLYSEAALNAHAGQPGGDPTSNALACAGVAGTVTPTLTNFADVLADGTNASSTPCDAISAAFAFRGVRAKAVQVAPASLSVASPDCDGLPAVFGTATPDEASCPPTSASCSIPAWNPAN